MSESQRLCSVVIVSLLFCSFLYAGLDLYISHLEGPAKVYAKKTLIPVCVFCWFLSILIVGYVYTEERREMFLIWVVLTLGRSVTLFSRDPEGKPTMTTVKTLGKYTVNITANTLHKRN